MAENTQFNISVPEKYEDNDGNEKTAWTTVGTAFKNGNDSISLRLPANISVSGDVVLFPKDKDSSPDEE